MNHRCGCGFQRVTYGKPFRLLLPLLNTLEFSRLVERANARRGSGDTLEKTLFVRLAALGLTPLLLGRQYRCHPRLSGLASRLFYQNRCARLVPARPGGSYIHRERLGARVRKRGGFNDK